MLKSYCSGLIFACLTIFDQLLVSFVTSDVHWAELPPAGVNPNSVRRCFISGDCKLILKAVLIFWTISFGTPAGKKIPHTILALTAG